MGALFIADHMMMPLVEIKMHTELLTLSDAETLGVSCGRWRHNQTQHNSCVAHMLVQPPQLCVLQVCESS